RSWTATTAFTCLLLCAKNSQPRLSGDEAVICCLAQLCTKEYTCPHLGCQDFARSFPPPAAGTYDEYAVLGCANGPKLLRVENGNVLQTQAKTEDHIQIL
ncbi:MAG: hypothetical protein JSV81_02010, partial [Anaerolineales bacterium]